MMNPRTLAIGAIAVVLSTHVLEGQGQPQYREFQLGSDLASVSALAGIAATDAKVVHQRPAVQKDLQWRPSHWMTGSTTAKTDPLQQVVFSFYNDELFRVVVDYDRERTDGMTDADMIEAISQAYGSPSKPDVKKTSAAAWPIVTESGTPVSWWAGPEYAVVLYRAPYGTAFRLIVTSPRLDALARTADAQSLRLDAREAPQREIARQKKEEDATRAAQEKARVANKATFKP